MSRQRRDGQDESQAQREQKAETKASDKSHQRSLLLIGQFAVAEQLPGRAMTCNSNNYCEGAAFLLQRKLGRADNSRPRRN